MIERPAYISLKINLHSMAYAHHLILIPKQLIRALFITLWVFYFFFRSGMYKTVDPYAILCVFFLIVVKLSVLHQRALVVQTNTQHSHPMSDHTLRVQI